MEIVEKGKKKNGKDAKDYTYIYILYQNSDFDEFIVGRLN